MATIDPAIVRAAIDMADRDSVVPVQLQAAKTVRAATEATLPEAARAVRAELDRREQVRERREFTDRHPKPGTDSVERLRHVLAVLGDGELDCNWALIATRGLYGPDVTTGLTFGDLRQLLAHTENPEG